MEPPSELSIRREVAKILAAIPNACARHISNTLKHVSWANATCIGYIHPFLLLVSTPFCIALAVYNARCTRYNPKSALCDLIVHVSPSALAQHFLTFVLDHYALPPCSCHPSTRGPPYPISLLIRFLCLSPLFITLAPRPPSSVFMFLGSVRRVRRDWAYKPGFDSQIRV